MVQTARCEKMHIYKWTENNMQLSEHDFKDTTAMFLFNWSIVKGTNKQQKSNNGHFSNMLQQFASKDGKNKQTNSNNNRKNTSTMLCNKLSKSQIYRRDSVFKRLMCVFLRSVSLILQIWHPSHIQINE